MNRPAEEQLREIQRGAFEITPHHALLSKLAKSLETRIPLRVKLGIDPTAPDIHLGHSVVLRKLRKFQELGHRVVLIIGDFTARIGDPSGKSETRKVLEEDEIKANTQTYLAQIGKILNTRDRQIFEIRYNSEWLSSLGFAKLIELARHFTVAQMLEREDFTKRYQSGKPIGLHEFFYPIMQGYDSVAVKADVELGGTDQKFNILVGREMQRVFGFAAPQIALLMPILEGTDGTQKMSKSLGNTVGIAESPDEMFGKVMSIPDPLMPRYFELLTDLPAAEVESLGKALESGRAHPREWKARLSEMIVASYYGEAAGKKSHENFDRVFRQKKAPDRVPEYVIPVELLRDGRVLVSKLLVSAALVPSVREAKRLLAQGGVEIEGESVAGENAVIQVRDGMTLHAGKRRFVRLRLG